MPGPLPLETGEPFPVGSYIETPRNDLEGGRAVLKFQIMRIVNRSIFFWLLIGVLGIATLLFGFIGLQKSKKALVIVEWKTASEINTAGFNLYRSESSTGPFTLINAELIPASPDPLIGGDYTYQDVTVDPGVKYYYQLEDIDFDGGSSRFGPIEVKAKAGGKTELVLAGMTAITLVVIVWVILVYYRRNAGDSQ